ncbi:MAG: hypothetical protein HY204_10705 [Nitrospirae bacterium]|nr:hypothetical protein [Nitrospirota bacterium]
MERKEPNQASDRLPSGRDQAAVSLGDVIDTLGRSFASHPGFMWTGSRFEILHADWPAYPRGHGITITLRVLAEYPRDTEFFSIDSIDQCTLFAVGEKPKQDPYGLQHLHVAVWDDDLRACASAGYAVIQAVDQGRRHDG